MTKKYILSLLFLIIASVVFAQQQISVKIWKGGKADIIEQIDSITFPNTTQHITCIDLGLSVKWGSCNIGAETPEAYGNYYACEKLVQKRTIVGTNINITNQYLRRLQNIMLPTR